MSRISITSCRFLRTTSGGLFLPFINIFIVFLSLILNPLISLGEIQLWMLSPLILIFINIRFNYSQIKLIRFYLPLILYLTIHFFISLIIQNFNIDTVSKFLLFIIEFSVFLILTSQSAKLVSNKESFEKLLHIIVLIVGVYGVYQFIGRQLGLPFTLDNLLRYRRWKVAGFYQISSFFEEPAFFSQFLVVLLFINLFFFEAKNIKIILLLIVNVLATISVTGVISMVIVIFLYVLSKISWKVKKVTTRRKLFSWLTFLLIIIATLVVVSTSGIGTYLNTRISNTFISASMRDRYIKEQLAQGGSANYDRSGYERVMNELYTLENIVFSKDAFIGYGINYSKILPHRTMALNAITEFVVRWGLIGLFLFLIPLFIFVWNNKFKYYIFLFLFLFFFIDGAIAKLSFWFLLSLLLVSSKIYIFNTKN